MWCAADERGDKTLRSLILSLVLSSPAMAGELPLPLDPSSVSTHGAWSAGRPFAGGLKSCAIAVRGDRLTFEVMASTSGPEVTLAMRSESWPVPLGDPVTVDVWAGWDHVLAQAPSEAQHSVIVHSELTNGLGSPTSPIGSQVIDDLVTASKSSEGDLRVEAIARSDVAGQIGEDLPRQGLSEALRVFRACRAKALG